MRLSENGRKEVNAYGFSLYTVDGKPTRSEPQIAQGYFSFKNNLHEASAELCAPE